MSLVDRVVLLGRAGLDTLAALGVDCVFGYPGGAIMPVYDALPQGTTRHILVRHEQAAAMIAFVKDTAKSYTRNVVKVVRAPIVLKNNHLKKQAHFSAGKIAEIKTRAFRKEDCVCTNEVIYYLPLTKVENYSPAFSLKMSYQGKGLNRRFTNFDTNSAFLATFRR